MHNMNIVLDQQNNEMFSLIITLQFSFYYLSLDTLRNMVNSFTYIN